MPFRVGVIGAGTHGSRYLRHAREDVPGMSPAVLCRRNRDLGAELARRFDCRYQAESADLIADPEVDGIIVATPPASHFPLACEVLAAGKPLLLEKPLTVSLAEARELCRLDASGAAPPLFLAQSLRWNPVILKVKELWPRLGRVHHVRLAQRLAPTQLAWQRDPAQSVGGSVLLTGVHLFDLARFLSGRECVEVDCRQRQVLHPCLEDFFLARATLDDGAWVSFEVSKYTRSRAAWLEAVGEEGQIWADYLNGGIRFRQDRQEEPHPVDATLPTLPRLLADWMVAARHQAAVPVTARDGLRTLEIVEACYRSHRERRAVLISEL
jgi:predicted dehydrogenase